MMEVALTASRMNTAPDHRLVFPHTLSFNAYLRLSLQVLLLLLLHILCMMD